MSTFRPAGAGLQAAAALISCFIGISASAAITNIGFEDGAIGATPPGWTLGPVVDAALVVGTEGPSNFPVYADKNITVAPFKGAKALRIGTPKRFAESQTRGTNRASQTFVPQSSDL